MKFEHNCEGCKFIGHYYGCDVYICSESIISRFGNKEWEYGSGRLEHVVKMLTNKKELESILKYDIKWEVAGLFALINLGAEDFIL